jgi:prepilin-type N-terminal cleavage/methylation domain-containing protein
VFGTIPVKKAAAPNKTETDSTQAGFTLIELSIYLLIIAILGGYALTAGTSQRGFAREKQTYDKMQVIESAIAAYVRINGRLPCPAVPTLARTNINLGTENCAGTIGGANSATVHIGTVPTAALLLSQDFITDGWDRRFIYAVDPAFITPRHFLNAVEQGGATGSGFITIVDGATAPAFGTAPPAATIRTDAATYVLMSAGADGAGAYPRDGGVTRVGAAPTNNGQGINYNLTNPAVAPLKKYFAQSMLTPAFDDIVHFRRKYQVTREAGGIIGGTIIRTSGASTAFDDCTAAKLSLMPISNPNNSTACSTSTPPANCKPLEGPVGCEDINAVFTTNPAYTSMVGGRRVINAQLNPIYQTLQRQSDCMARQMKLAEKVYERCVYR